MAFNIPDRKRHDPVVVQRMLRQSHLDMTMHCVHNSRQARDPQGQFIRRFLPSGECPSIRQEVQGERSQCGCGDLGTFGGKSVSAVK